MQNDLLCRKNIAVLIRVLNVSVAVLLALLWERAINELTYPQIWHWPTLLTIVIMSIFSGWAITASSSAPKRWLALFDGAWVLCALFSVVGLGAAYLTEKAQGEVEHRRAIAAIYNERISAQAKLAYEALLRSDAPANKHLIAVLVAHAERRPNRDQHNDLLTSQELVKSVDDDGVKLALTQLGEGIRDRDRALEGPSPYDEVRDSVDLSELVELFFPLIAAIGLGLRLTKSGHDIRTAWGTSNR